jgi:hypothetical protein
VAKLEKQSAIPLSVEANTLQFFGESERLARAHETNTQDMLVSR